LDAETNNSQAVVVIGAGPAGLYAARELASSGARVAVINRDVKPGGLAEYGIYPTKHKMKEGLRKQFRQILQVPNLDYYGNITVGEDGDITLKDLKAAGYKTVLVTAGAQGTKWLGLPGEDIPKGVYHAKDIVYHYNRLPPNSLKTYHIGKRVALVGAGNVMLDIARWLIRQVKVDEVTAVVRRGPAEVKFDKKEMEYVIANLDLQDLDEELQRVTPVMESVGQDVSEAREYIHSALPKAMEPVSQTAFHLRFLSSPVRILGDEHVTGLEIEETVLVRTNGDTKAKGTGVKHIMEIDSVIFAIGDKVDEAFGLPVKWNAFVKNPEPKYPVDEISYEAFDPEAEKPVEGVFLAGWSREASSGLVGLARKDGERAAKAVLQYMAGLPDGSTTGAPEALEALLEKLDKPVIRKEDIARLEAVEQAEAERQGLEEFKYASNEEMLTAMGLAVEA
jgi:ferredoxin--NADP+ reductase